MPQFVEEYNLDIVSTTVELFLACVGLIMHANPNAGSYSILEVGDFA